MRLKRGRPDLAAYRDRFAVPEADDDTQVGVTFLGVSTLLFDDGRSAVMTDGFFSRPGLRSVLTGRIAPDPARITASLIRAEARSLAAVLPVHTHYDHALDSAEVAARTGALLVGGESAAALAHGHGIAPERIVVASDGSAHALGNFD